MSYGGVPLDGIDDAVSEVGIVACELVGKSRKDPFELSAVEVIPGTEEASAEGSIVGECS